MHVTHRIYVYSIAHVYILHGPAPAQRAHVCTCHQGYHTHKYIYVPTNVELSPVSPGHEFYGLRVVAGETRPFRAFIRAAKTGCPVVATTNCAFARPCQGDRCQERASHLASPTWQELEAICTCELRSTPLVSQRGMELIEVVFVKNET